METQTGRENSSSGEMFSFPSTPPIQDQDSDFEFGSITPDSPSTFNNSPADHLFLNGRLLPHSFPLEPTIDISRPTSRTSSVGSKDSFMSSRSNSTNSRSSCSSARTSSSDIAHSERSRSSYTYLKKGQKSMVSTHVYGSSKRWQFIASVPVAATLSRENSRRKKMEVVDGNKAELRRKKRKTTKKKKMKMWFGRRVFRWIILVCKECHAIEPSKKNDLLKNMKPMPKPKPKPKLNSHSHSHSR